MMKRTIAYLGFCALFTLAACGSAQSTLRDHRATVTSDSSGTPSCSCDGDPNAICVEDASQSANGEAAIACQPRTVCPVPSNITDPFEIACICQGAVLVPPGSSVNGAANLGGCHVSATVKNLCVCNSDVDGSDGGVARDGGDAGDGGVDGGSAGRACTGDADCAQGWLCIGYSQPCPGAPQDYTVGTGTCHRDCADGSCACNNTPQADCRPGFTCDQGQCLAEPVNCPLLPATCPAGCTLKLATDGVCGPTCLCDTCPALPPSAAN